MSLDYLKAGPESPLPEEGLEAGQADEHQQGHEDERDAEHPPEVRAGGKVRGRVRRGANVAHPVGDESLSGDQRSLDQGRHREFDRADDEGQASEGLPVLPGERHRGSVLQSVRCGLSGFRTTGAGP